MESSSVGTRASYRASFSCRPPWCWGRARQNEGLTFRESGTDPSHLLFRPCPLLPILLSHHALGQDCRFTTQLEPGREGLALCLA